MDVKKFPALIVGVVVALVLAGAVLPVFAETTSATDTFKNEYYYTMDSIVDDSNVVITWDSSKPLILTINDNDLDMSIVERGKSYTLVGSDKVIVRALVGNTTMTFQVFGENYGNSGNGTNVTITLASNTVVLQSNRSDIPDYSVTNTGVNEGVIINPDGTGDYAVMKRADKPAYVLNDSEIMLIGITEVSTNNIGVYAKGTLEDGLNFSVAYAPANVDVTFGTETATKSDVNNYVDLYLLDKFDFTISDGTNIIDATYSYFLVPSEVNAEKAVHPDWALAVMLNVLPLLAIAGLVTGAVVWFITRKG